MIVILGLTLIASTVVGQMLPAPPPPPYNMYGPINPYGPMPMMAPPMAPYPSSTSVSYSGFPIMAPAAASPYPAMAPPISSPYGAMAPAAAAPYPAYGMPPPAPPSQPMMYPPPYQTFSGSGPMGDPFTSTTGGNSGFFNARALSQFLGLRKRR